MLPEFAPKHLYKTVFLKFLKTRHTLFLSFAFHFHTFLNIRSRKTILWTPDIYLHCIFLFLLKVLCKGCLLILQTDPTRILDFWIFPRHYMSSYNQSIQTMAQALKWNVYVGVNFYVAIRSLVKYSRHNFIIFFVPGHWFLLHFSFSVSSPGQNNFTFSLFWGFVFKIHFLVLSWDPPPHVTEHGVHADHGVQEGQVFSLHFLKCYKWEAKI